MSDHAGYPLIPNSMPCDVKSYEKWSALYGEANYLKQMDLEDEFNEELLIEMGLLKYRFATNEKGIIEGIQCLNCKWTSYHPEDVDDLRCPRCEISLKPSVEVNNDKS